MKKILLTLTLLTHLSFSATPEQVEQYLTVSNAEEQLIAMQAQYSAIQNNIPKDTNSTENTYDMQMLSIRFKDYLQKHLSEDEMTEVLENYKNVVLLQFVSAENNMEDLDRNESSAYLQKLESDPEAGTRIELVNKISKALYSKESMMVMFDDLLGPLIKTGIGGDKLNDKMLKGMKENYIKQMNESAKNTTLLTCKDFTMKDLEELLKIAQTPAIQHEVKAVFGAMAYSLKEFFMSMASRYNVEKHRSASSNTNVKKEIKQNQPKPVNNTK